MLSVPKHALFDWRGWYWPSGVAALESGHSFSFEAGLYLRLTRLPPPPHVTSGVCAARDPPQGLVFVQ